MHTTNMLYQEDTLHSDLRTIKSARNTGGRLWIATYINGAKNVKHVNVEKQLTTDLNYQQAIYL